MARKFDRMPDLPKTVNDPKVEEFMEHYYAMSNAPNNKESDDEFIGMFTKDGQYCFNHKVATGHAGIFIEFFLFFCRLPSKSRKFYDG